MPNGPIEVVNLQGAQQVDPPRAPVSAQLSGRERHGIYLTWGVLGIIVVVLLAAGLILWSAESRSSQALTALIDSAQFDAAKSKIIVDERTAFRSFRLTFPPNRCAYR